MDQAGRAERLVDVLDQAIAALQQASGVRLAALVEQLRTAQAALQAAANPRTAPSGSAPDTIALAEWWHDMRTPAGSIAGWAYLLNQGSNEAVRLRATDAIERNVKQLLEMLAHPPTGREPG
jgi:signal transduction histidine kinase